MTVVKKQKTKQGVEKERRKWKVKQRKHVERRKELQASYQENMAAQDQPGKGKKMYIFNWIYKNKFFKKKS